MFASINAMQMNGIAGGWLVYTMTDSPLALGILCYMPVHGSIFNSFPANSAIIAFLVVVPVVSLGILAIFGGIRNLKREKWGWALLGSIAAAIFTIIGVASIVLTALSKEEFTR